MDPHLVKKTLYVSRAVINAEELTKWAGAVGLADRYLPDDLHVTVAFSRKKVDWSNWEPDDEKIVIKELSRGREMLLLGKDEKVVVLGFRSRRLKERWKGFVDGGCSWDFPSYRPHVTLAKDLGEAELDKLDPYDGKIVLGSEKFAVVDEDWKDKVETVDEDIIKKFVRETFARSGAN